MKKILQKLFSSKDTKKTNALTAWVGDLDEMADLAALQFSSNQLALTLNRADGEDVLNLQQQLDLIIEIEALNQPRLERLSTQFSSVENMKVDIANNISEICYHFVANLMFVISKSLKKCLTPTEHN
jgi:hypothetical protein